MTFLALLTKELRLRMRRERTIWVIVAYICFMGILGFFTIYRYNSPINYTNSTLSTAGNTLYLLLALLELLLIVFITPAFTATVINSEKERQTFDLLLCSRLSSFSLVGGKLLAGLMNALLLIVASAPLFSLVFFFGGVSPIQVIQTLAIFVITTVVVGCIGLFCSTLFKRPAISTSITYMICLLWLGLPLILHYLTLSNGTSVGIVVLNGGTVGTIQGSNLASTATPSPMPLWQSWNPLTALFSANPSFATSSLPFNVSNYYVPFQTFTFANTTTLPGGPFTTNAAASTTQLLGASLSQFNAFTILSLILSAVLFLVSMLIIKPDSLKYLFHRFLGLTGFQHRDDEITIESLEPDEASAKA